jgi:alkylation response protein AidB-like acyl-CoA dehydrogenase
MRPRDLLTDALLGRLRGGDGADPPALTRDIARLRDAGYLSVTLPPELGGLGCTLRQAACGQRRLAGVAPRTALAISAHLYWTGAAADGCRSGDTSVKWILLEAAQGALFGGGHGEPGNDLKLAAPDSRCDPAGESGYRFRDPGTALASVTPHWDWLAVHALAQLCAGHQAVLAFAGRGARCTPAYRVARVLPPGVPRAGNPLDRWPVAEASLRLDALKARIADVTHPWPLVPEPGPDVGGQQLIAIFAMRHEVAEGAARVRALSASITGAADAAPTPAPRSAASPA